MERRLAAILFADITGYTAMMQEDESVALEKLNRFKETLETKAVEHQGEFIQYYGDGCLMLFNSSAEAVKFAAEVQKSFIKEPLLPVRIGIHSGEVVFKEGNVFGDAVNIASRVESLGVPGAVLLSSSVRNQIKNHKEFKLVSLGRFEFKNVESSMTIYALANGGIPVPEREDMKGKLKVAAPDKKKNKWLVPAIIGILLLGIFGYWKSFSNDNNTNSSTPLSEEIRQKRVAVMVFENKTGSVELDDFGIMISDWITQGLMETGEAKMINAGFVQKNIQLASTVETAGAEFSKATGAGVVIQGNYYFQENQLIVNAQVVNAQNGDILYALSPLQRAKEDKMDLLDELVQKLLGFWVVGKYKRFTKKPPKYDAYQTYMEVEQKWWDVSDEKSEELILKSFTLDSTFYVPLLKLAVLYINQNKHARADSLITFIKKKNPPLTQWERWRLQAMENATKGNLKQNASLYEKMYAMDSTDYVSNYMAGRLNVLISQPERAIQILESFDYRYEPSEFLDSDYRMIWISEAYFSLDNYEKVCQLAMDDSYPQIPVPLALVHIKSLVRLDSLDRIDHYLEKYEKYDIRRTRGWLWWNLCFEMKRAGKEELLKKYARQFIKVMTAEKEREPYNYLIAYAYYYLKDYRKALSLLQEPDLTNHWELSAAGVCYAAIGDTSLAKKMISQIEAIDEPYDFGTKNYFQAHIETALGNKEKAVELLKTALLKGTGFRYWSFKNDVFLMPLFGYPPFEELVKPKG